MVPDVRGKGVVVTGGGNGIGRALASRMAKAGAHVVVNDVDCDAAYEVAAEIGGHPVPGEAASESGVAALITAARRRLGAIDVYFGNAGINVGRGLDTAAEVWNKAIEVNVMAHVHAAQRLVPTWLRTGGGRFVVTGSAAGLLTMLGGAPYSVTQHAAIAFAEWLSATYGHRGVVVQAICPQDGRTLRLDNGGSRQRLPTRDTALEPEQIAEAVWHALADDRFLILPQPEVQAYFELRAARTDEWLAGMRELQRRIGDEWL